MPSPLKGIDMKVKIIVDMADHKALQLIAQGKAEAVEVEKPVEPIAKPIELEDVKVPVLKRKKRKAKKKC